MLFAVDPPVTEKPAVALLSGLALGESDNADDTVFEGDIDVVTVEFADAVEEAEAAFSAVSAADAVDTRDARAVTEGERDDECDAESERDMRVVLLARADADSLKDALTDAEIESERRPVVDGVAVPSTLFDCTFVDDIAGETVVSADS